MPIVFIADSPTGRLAALNRILLRTNAHAQPHAVRQVTAGGALRSYCYDANGNLTTISGANAGYTTVSWWASNLAR